MSVSVIIVNWNSGALLTKCLEHLQLQTISPTRVFVIDNASSDDSASNAEAFANVTLIRMVSNHGFAGGNNVAIAQSDTEFVAVLNPDAFPDRDWLQSLLVAASALPDVAAFGCRQLRDGAPDVLDGIGDSYHFSGSVWRDRHGAQQEERDLISREIFSPCAAAALYRRQALLDVGGFDEEYFCYLEDVDLGFRLRLAGHKAVYVPNAVVHHVGSATTGGQHSDFSVYHGHRNVVWTYIKNMPGLLFWFCLPLHIAANIYIVVRYALKGRWRVILKAKRDAIKGIPGMWRKRSLIQAQRKASVSDIWQILDARVWPSRLYGALRREMSAK